MVLHSKMTRSTNPTPTQRRSAALTICKTLANELSVVAKPLSRVNIKNIPDSVEPAIRTWIKKHAGKHEVYGSAAAATHRIGGRRAGDLDIIVADPRTAANAVAAIMRRKKIRCQIAERKVGGGLVIKVQKGGKWVEAVDFNSPDGHVGKYELYGETKPPMKKKGVTIQRASDQMLRKANEITKKQPDGTTGAAPHRNLKDTRDFIETSKTLLASLILKSKADQQRAKKVRKAITVWERHLKTLEGAPKPAKRKPISKTRTKRFEQKARANPEPDTDDLIFIGSTPKVVERDARRQPAGMPYAGTGYAGDPYARDPYGGGGQAVARDPYGGGGEAREAEDALERLVGRRRGGIRAL